MNPLSIRPTRFIRFGTLILLACTNAVAGAQMMGPGMRDGMMAPGQMNGLSQPYGAAAPANTRSAREFAQICAQCHALPNPRIHTSAQWPYVVSRMERIIRATGQPLPSRHTMNDITDYLESNAADR